MGIRVVLVCGYFSQYGGGYKHHSLAQGSQNHKIDYREVSPDPLKRRLRQFDSGCATTGANESEVELPPPPAKCKRPTEPSIGSAPQPKMRVTFDLQKPTKCWSPVKVGTTKFGPQGTYAHSEEAAKVSGQAGVLVPTSLAHLCLETRQ